MTQPLERDADNLLEEDVDLNRDMVPDVIVDAIPVIIAGDVRAKTADGDVSGWANWNILTPDAATPATVRLLPLDKKRKKAQIFIIAATNAVVVIGNKQQMSGTYPLDAANHPLGSAPQFVVGNIITIESAPEVYVTVIPQGGIGNAVISTLDERYQ